MKIKMTMNSFRKKLKLINHTLKIWKVFCWIIMETKRTKRKRMEKGLNENGTKMRRKKMRRIKEKIAKKRRAMDLRRLITAYLIWKNPKKKRQKLTK